MFCMNCGAKLSENDQHCGQCGETVSAATTPASTQNFAIGVTESSAFKGFLILITSWFAMPISTMKLSMRLLRDIGDRGIIDNSDDWPHLNWWRVAAPFLATLVFIVICIMGLFAFIKTIQFGAQGFWGLFSPFLVLFATYLIAIAVDWAIMVVAEIISICISNANNLKTIADKSTRH